MDIFGNVWKSAENRRKCSEIPVMTRQKRQAYDSEKVGRYNLVLIFRGNKMANFCYQVLKQLGSYTKFF